MLSKRPLRNLLPVLALAASMSLVLWACSGEGDVVSPQVDKPTMAGNTFSVAHPEVQRAIGVQNKHTPTLMEDPEIVGTAVGMNDSGEIILKVYTENNLGSDKVPFEIDGLEVEQMVTGKIVARKGGPPPMGGNGTDPRAPQSAPVKMGTSGGWRYDLANGYCCGGTLGSLIQSGGTKYILSNWHVLYADHVSGGNNRVASAGDPVIQPALIDVGCDANQSLNVGELVNNGGSLPNNNIDAGIAQVTPGMVDESGAILEIGTISSSTVGAFVGQDVKKMGRTTGLGRATVDGLNATISITYENECAGGTAFTKMFTGQIVTTNNRCKFLDGGDSGSLMVEDVTSNPRAVGLLFAGSVSCNKFAIAIANPIGDVLSHYNASMVGN